MTDITADGGTLFKFSARDSVILSANIDKNIYYFRINNIISYLHYLIEFLEVMDVLFVKDVEEEEHSVVDFVRFVNVLTIHQHDPIYLEIHFVLLQNKKYLYIGNK